MRTYLSIVPLTVLYIALTGNGEALNWLLGVVLATVITLLLPTSRGSFSWRRLPGAGLATVQYTLLLLLDLVISSVQVARIVLKAAMPLRQGIFALPSGSDDRRITALSAHAITLTPGELVVEIDDDGVIYVHSLDVVRSLSNAQPAQQRRVALLERIVQ